jgi:hypothetical protein
MATTDPYHFYVPDMESKFNVHSGYPMCKCGQNYECHIHFDLNQMLSIRKARQQVEQYR